MDRVKHSTAVALLPTFVDNGATPGYFQDENLALGQEGTVVPAWWLNQIQEELRAVIVAGGGTPSPSNLTQVLTAINALISTAIAAIPDASTSQKGIVQLTDSVISSSTTTAATANSAKAAYDRGSQGVTAAAAAQSTADAALPKAGGVTMTGTFVAALGQEVEFANRIAPPATLTYAIGELAVAEDLRGAGNYGWGHNDTLPTSGAGVWGVRDATDTLIYPSGTWKSFGQWRDTDGAFDPKHYSFIVRVS